MGTVAWTPYTGELADRSHSSYKDLHVLRGQFTGSSSYATGGDTIPVATIGMKEIRQLLVDGTGVLNNVSGLSVTLDATNPTAPKLLCWDANAVEVANLTNLSTRVFHVWLLGYTA